MKKIMLVVILLILTGCLEQKPRAPRVAGVYTIWVGNGIISVGYEADEYIKENGMINFTNKRTGKGMAVPFDNLASIDTN